MYDDTQVDSMNALFPVRQTVDYDSKVRGNYYQRVKLTPVLAADEVCPFFYTGNLFFPHDFGNFLQFFYFMVDFLYLQ